MGHSSKACLVCGRDMLSRWSDEMAPEWMRQVVVFMPDGLKLTGRYDGYMSVETGETFFSKSVSEKWINKKDDWSGISPIFFREVFDKEACDADRGYLTLHMWRDQYIYSPSCYHRSCWEAVGSPEGYRAPSLHSIDQGSGSGAWVYGPTSSTAGIEYEEDMGNRDIGPLITEPKPGPEAIHLWAVNSICYFFYMVYAWANAQAAAQDRRDMWKRMDETKLLLERIDKELAKDV